MHSAFQLKEGEKNSFVGRAPIVIIFIKINIIHKYSMNKIH